MSDDVFAVRTTYQDVAELGQGYLERADGERMLLPLPNELEAGEGVRFIVYLADGTPAFAGAGRCVQVSDQGTEVASDDRYETLIDALVFDERSRPVYDYIVAVRQMAYADLGAAAEAEAADGEEAVLESDEPTTHSEAAHPELIAESMRAEAVTSADTFSVAPNAESIAPEREGEAEPEREREDEREAYAEPEAEAEPDFSANEFNTDAMDAPLESEETSHSFPDKTPSDHNAGVSFAELERSSAPAEEYVEERLGDQPESPRSLMPMATGILQRPAIAAGWRPAAPTRPQPHPGTGLFRYAAGSLPIPARPPRPDLRPEDRVQPASRP